MKKILTATLLLAMVGGQAIAHSGRTDSNGGHNCSQKSKDKELCTGYHYSNDGDLHADLTDEVINPSKVSVKMASEALPAYTNKDCLTVQYKECIRSNIQHQAIVLNTILLFSFWK